jgi:hypothetical protein
VGTVIMPTQQDASVPSDGNLPAVVPQKADHIRVVVNLSVPDASAEGMSDVSNRIGTGYQTQMYHNIVVQGYRLIRAADCRLVCLGRAGRQAGERELAEQACPSRLRLA